MKRQDFIDAFLEGSALAPKDELITGLIGKLFDERTTSNRFIETIDFMNDVARTRNTSWTMTCRSCGKDYEPDCELSEMFGSENYCGSNQWCTP